MVLARVEHFEQRAGGIAAKIGAELVDFVEHDHWIARAGAAEFLDDAAGHRADVSAAMAADFCFVANAAQAHPSEFAAERIGDGLAETGFADARRAQKTENRPVAGRD